MAGRHHPVLQRKVLELVGLEERVVAGHRLPAVSNYANERRNAPDPVGSWRYQQFACACRPERSGGSKEPPMTDAKNLTQLGKHVETPQSPEQAVLEIVPFQRGDGPPAIVRFTCPEFTSLCPVTGQPDFAHIVIDYAPDRTLVESKSLKLFMTSFRNHGAFHEECTVMIGRRIVEATKPLWLRVGGYWFPRGGIPIDVFWQTGAPPKDAWLPDTGVAPYRGRG
jgi:7-cyano-7-deazaguanine reductase